MAVPRRPRLMVVGDFRWQVYERSFCDGLRRIGAEVLEVPAWRFWGPGDLLRSAQTRFCMGPGPAAANTALLALCALHRPDVVLAWRTPWLWRTTIRMLSIVPSSAIFPSPNCITKMSDNGSWTKTPVTSVLSSPLALRRTPCPRVTLGRKRAHQVFNVRRGCPPCPADSGSETVVLRAAGNAVDLEFRQSDILGRWAHGVDGQANARDQLGNEMDSINYGGRCPPYIFFFFRQSQSLLKPDC